MSPNQSVLYLTPYPPEWGGIADYASSFRDAVQQYTDWRLRLAPQQLVQRVASPRDFLRLRDQVRRWHLDGVLEGIDLIHAEIGYRQHREFYTLFWLSRIIPHIPFVITIHDPPLVIAPAMSPLFFGWQSNHARKALRLLDKTPIGKRVIHAVLSQSAMLFTLTKAGRDSIKRSFSLEQQVSAIPLVSYGSPDLQAQRQPFFEHTVRILFAGFWGKAKGVHILIDAMALLFKKHGADVRLMLSGGLEPNGQNAEYVVNVLQRVNDSPARSVIEIVGYVSDEALGRLFSTVDIVALPYVQSPGFSASSILTRAMTNGLAVVASNVDVMSEAIHDSKTGLLVKPNDVTALADALSLLLSDATKRRYLGEAAQHYMAKHHNRQTVAELIARHYEEICRRHTQSDVACGTL